MIVDFLTSKYHRTLQDAWGALEIGNLEKAEGHFKTILKHTEDPHMEMHDLADAHTGLGAVSMAHKDFFEATRWYKEAHHILDTMYGTNWPKRLAWHSPADRPALRTLIGLGHLAYHKGRTKTAQKYYEELLAHDPKDELGVKRYVEAIEQRRAFEELE